MTTPDEPICGPFCTPDCGMGHCALEQPKVPKSVTSPTSGNDLRQRLADALYQWTLKAAAGGRPLIPQHEANVRENSAARAEVCGAVVQPVLDAKDAEIAQRKGDVDTELEGDSDYWRKRAEAAEAQLRYQNGDRT